MTTNIRGSFSHFSDDALLNEVRRLATRERRATAQLVASLAELDARRLYLAQGCSSLFTYCTQVLYLSEQAAYGRIQAARAARRFPVILDLLTDGAIHLTAVGLLTPHLTDANHRELLDAARHRSKRDVEQLVARLHPQSDAVTIVRKLPAPRTAEALLATRAETSLDVATGPMTAEPVTLSNTPSSRSEVRALAPERYKVQFTVSRDTYEKLCRAQDLLRHAIPNGDPAVVFDRALTALLDNLERTKLAATSRPRAARTPASESRHIPAAVKRDVWKRDAGRCGFVGAAGRCTETGFLEFHHVVPYAAGGQAVAENVELRCRAHNAYESEQYFGTLFVRETRDSMGADWVRT